MVQIKQAENILKIKKEKTFFELFIQKIIQINYTVIFLVPLIVCCRCEAVFHYEAHADLRLMICLPRVPKGRHSSMLTLHLAKKQFLNETLLYFISSFKAQNIRHKSKTKKKIVGENSRVPLNQDAD